MPGDHTYSSFLATELRSNMKSFSLKGLQISQI